MAVLHYCYSFTSDVLKKDLAGTPDEGNRPASTLS